MKNAESYIVKYGTESGNYTQKATVTKDVYGKFEIRGLTNGTTYYFVVGSVINGVESGYSNEVAATPQAATQPKPEPEPTGNRAILVVTLIDGIEKEYDLPMSEVNAFINWYDSKDAGTGPSKYAINKHSNNKGPFSKRTDFVLFDKILTFEVNEYSAASTSKQ
ncbi:fibronectin type III domain-containing protein [Paenibacillus sp. DMB20]|uniref:fibronectin type III domain-containing protein n=1 Tax=Paenibacillus sp. DMB20 TaxID=1642570 RepID=UPI001F46C03C|nr:fibronectin type III domain-containing protein [Paenibacillus sp. DMB20]